MFTLPDFNLVAAVWFFPHTPAANVPDIPATQVQLYWTPRPSIDFLPGGGFYSPSLFIRVPLATAFAMPQPWVGSIFALADEAANVWFYNIKFCEEQHQGFPNAYMMFQVDQCDSSGLPHQKGG